MSNGSYLFETDLWGFKKLRVLSPQLFVCLGLLHRELNFGGQITLCYRAVE